MKKLAKVEEVEMEGLLLFLEKRVTVFCDTYIYSGKLVGVNDTFIKLDDVSVVYETGKLTDKDWKYAEKFPNALYVMISHIECFCELK